MTPFFAKMSTFVTFPDPEDDLTVTPPLERETVIFSPPAVVRSVSPSGISPARILLGTTCLRRTFFKAFSSFRRLSSEF